MPGKVRLSRVVDVFPAVVDYPAHGEMTLPLVIRGLEGGNSFMNLVFTHEAASKLNWPVLRDVVAWLKSPQTGGVA